MRFGERIYEKIFAGARPSWWDGFPFVSLRRRVLIGFCVLPLPDELGSGLNSHPLDVNSPSTAQCGAYERVLGHAVFRPEGDGAHVLD